VRIAKVERDYFFEKPAVEKQGSISSYILRQIGNLFLIGFGSIAVFSLLMPAVFVKTKYLLEGTIGFSTPVRRRPPRHPLVATTRGPAPVLGLVASRVAVHDSVSIG